MGGQVSASDYNLTFIGKLVKTRYIICIAKLAELIKI